MCKVIPSRNKSNQGERCENACIFIAEPKGFVLVQIRDDKKAGMTSRVKKIFSSFYKNVFF